MDTSRFNSTEKIIDLMEYAKDFENQINYENALEIYQHILAIEPEYAEVYFYIGRIMFKQVRNLHG